MIDSIRRDEVDPLVANLGLVAGILKEDTSDPPAFNFDSNWFEDPVSADFFANLVKQLRPLLDMLLGSIPEIGLGLHFSKLETRCCTWQITPCLRFQHETSPSFPAIRQWQIAWNLAGNFLSLMHSEIPDQLVTAVNNLIEVNC